MTRMRSGVRLPLRPLALSREFVAEGAFGRLPKVVWVPFWVPFSRTDLLGRSRTAVENILNRELAYRLVRRRRHSDGGCLVRVRGAQRPSRAVTALGSAVGQRAQGHEVCAAMRRHVRQDVVVGHKDEVS